MATTDRSALDHRVLTTGCGLLDRSERGKLALTGPGAKEFLTGQVTNDIVGLARGEGRYAAFLTPKGKMRGDLRVLDLGEELLLDTERSTLQDLFTMIHRHRIGYELELHKRTLQRGLISLVGPQARRVAGAGSLGDTEHDNAALDVDGIATVAVTTDVGVDLICASEDTAALVTALVRRGAVVVEEPAAEVLRVERGRPRYGIDLDDTVIPQEAGLNDRAVSFTKGCYVGQETVARLFYKGRPNRHLRGLALSGPAETGERLTLGDKVVGQVGSSVVSPGLGPIALALVRREAEPGDTVLVGEDGVTAEVVALPFAVPPTG